MSEQNGPVDASAGAVEAPINRPAERPVMLPASIPEAWLTSIKDAVKQDKKNLILAAVLSSSVLAAVITGGINYIVKWQDYGVQAATAELTQKRTAYNSLLEDFEGFEAALSGSIEVLRYASDSNHRDTNRLVSQSITAVATEMALVWKSSHDAEIDGKLTQRVEALLKAIEPAFYEPVNRDAALRGLVRLYQERLRKDIASLKSDIVTRRNALAKETS